MQRAISLAFSYVLLALGVMLILSSINFWMELQQRDILKSSVDSLNEEVKYSGYISKQEYDSFVKSISNKPYKIYLQHTHREIDKNGNEVLTVNNLRNMVLDLENSSKHNRYLFRKGDDFQITIVPQYTNPLSYIFIGPINRGGMILKDLY